MQQESVRALLSAQLARPCTGDAQLLAEDLAARAGVLGVLFYGNLQRDPDAGGLFDFYVLTERDAAYHGAGLSALANRLLPPNVYFHTHPDGPKAKVAVMRLEAFAHRMRAGAWDTTLWARFCQPSTLIHAKDDAVRAQVLDAVTTAHRTAAQWAVELSAPDAGPRQAWETLFQHTYAAELRVEGNRRAQMLADQGGALYELLHGEALEAGGQSKPAQAQRAWRQRRWVGKLLNAARLVKACFTFRGALAYGLDKVERHSGRPVILSAWEQRHPWLAAPIVIVRLLRERRLR